MKDSVLMNSFNVHIKTFSIIKSEPTHGGFVQEVQLGVEALDFWVFLLDDADDEVQQRLLAVRGFSFQQLGTARTDSISQVEQVSTGSDGSSSDFRCVPHQVEALQAEAVRGSSLAAVHVVSKR